MERNRDNERIEPIELNNAPRVVPVELEEAVLDVDRARPAGVEVLRIRNTFEYDRRPAAKVQLTPEHEIDAAFVHEPPLPTVNTPEHTAADTLAHTLRTFEEPASHHPPVHRLAHEREKYVIPSDVWPDRALEHGPAPVETDVVRIAPLRPFVPLKR